MITYFDSIENMEILCRFSDIPVRMLLYNKGWQNIIITLFLIRKVQATGFA